jgi:hypothetical protein
VEVVPQPLSSWLPSLRFVTRLLALGLVAAALPAPGSPAGAATVPTGVGEALARTGAATVPTGVGEALARTGPAPSRPERIRSVPTRPEEGEIVRLYRSALGRAPDSDGFRYWVIRRVEGVPLAVVADSFLTSREFEIRFGADDDAGFVDLVYRNVLGRRGDDQGVAYWRRELAAGLTRHHLIVLFSQSAELRRLTATDLPHLPPFTSAIRTVTAAELGASWYPSCPVDPADLRAVEITHLGYDGAAHQGTVVVHRSAAEPVITVFERLYQARFPIASLRPVADYGGDDGASMAAGNSSGFNCRPVTGGRGWSRHAYGLAIDLNPVENPYVAGTTVLPPAGMTRVDRASYHPGMIRPGDVVVTAFASIGWTWGGSFRSLADYQHFQRS